MANRGEIGHFRRFFFLLSSVLFRLFLFFSTVGKPLEMAPTHQCRWRSIRSSSSFIGWLNFSSFSFMGMYRHSMHSFIHSFIRFVGPSVGWKRRAWRAAFVFYFVFLCLSLVSVGFFVVCFLFLRARVCVFRLAAGSFSAPRLLFALDVFFLNYHLDSDVHRLDSSIIRAFLLADSHLDRSQWKSSLEEIE